MPPAPDELELLRRLIAFETPSARSNLEIVDFLSELLDLPGVSLERIPSETGGKATLVALVGGAFEDPATRAGLTLCGHLDTVPAEEEGWTGDPFRLREEEDRLIGRGVCDMKGFVAIAVSVFLRAAEERWRLPLALVLTHDEEIGALGARRLAEVWPSERALPRRVIVGEPTDGWVVTRHKGHLKLRVVVAGRSAHSGLPHLGENAIEKAAEVIRALEALRRSLEGERVAGSDRFEPTPFVTLNVGRIEGGSAVNVVPDRCVLDIGLRTLPGVDGEALSRRVAEAARSAVEDVRVEPLGETPPLKTADDDPFVRELRSCLDGRSLGAVAFASDGGWLQRMGLTPLLWGAGDMTQAHRADEWLTRAQFEGFRRDLKGVLTRLGERLGRAEGSGAA